MGVALAHLDNFKSKVEKKYDVRRQKKLLDETLTGKTGLYMTEINMFETKVPNSEFSLKPGGTAIYLLLRYFDGEVLF